MTSLNTGARVLRVLRCGRSLNPPRAQSVVLSLIPCLPQWAKLRARRAVQLIKDWFAMLGNWRTAITDLAEDLSEAAGNTAPSITWPPRRAQA